MDEQTRTVLLTLADAVEHLAKCVRTRTGDYDARVAQEAAAAARKVLTEAQAA